MADENEYWIKYFVDCLKCLWKQGSLTWWSYKQRTGPNRLDSKMLCRLQFHAEILIRNVGNSGETWDIDGNNLYYSWWILFKVWRNRKYFLHRSTFMENIVFNSMTASQALRWPLRENTQKLKEILLKFLLCSVGISYYGWLSREVSRGEAGRQSH